MAVENIGLNFITNTYSAEMTCKFKYISEYGSNPVEIGLMMIIDRKSIEFS